MQQAQELVAVHLSIEQWNVLGSILAEQPAKLTRVILNEIERQHNEHTQRKMLGPPRLVTSSEDAPSV